MKDGGPKVKQRKGVRENPDGTVSSHLMRAEKTDKGWVAFPSLFQDDDGTWVDMSKEENWEKILDEAKKRGEVYEFGDDKFGALAFGMGSWKPENQNYNLKRALELGYEPDETGHLPSVDEETGMFLKSMDHPTAFKEYMYGQLNKDIGTNTRVVVNPEGPFGNKQLQYVEAELTDKEAEEYRLGGYIVEEMHEGGSPHSHPHEDEVTVTRSRKDPPSKYYDKDGNLIEDVPSYGTIYTSDPNDPRIQEFKDRLHLYNLSKNNYLDIRRDAFDGSIKSMKDTINHWNSIGEPDQAEEPKRILEKLIKQKKNLSGKDYLNHYRGQKGGYDVSETDLFDDILSGNFDEYKTYGKILPPDMDNYTQKELGKITGLYYSGGLNQKDADILQQGLKLGYEPYVNNIWEGGVLIDYPYPSLTVRYADPEKYDWAKPVEEEPEIEIDRLPILKSKLDDLDVSLPEGRKANFEEFNLEPTNWSGFEKPQKRKLRDFSPEKEPRVRGPRKRSNDGKRRYNLTRRRKKIKQEGGPVVKQSGGNVSWDFKGKSYSGTLIPSMETDEARYARTENGKVKTLPKRFEGGDGGGTYTVKSGDTFRGIANRLGIPFEDLEKANPGINYDKLSLGQVLNLPEAAKVEEEIVEEVEEVAETPTSLSNYYLKQAFAESSFRPDVITGKTKSSKGAQGLAQFMPDTMKDMVRLGIVDESFDPYDPAQAAAAQIGYMNWISGRPYLNKGEDFVKNAKFLSGYNLGVGNVKNALTKAKADGIDIYNTLDWLNTNYVPQETVDYVDRITGKVEDFDIKFDKAVSDTTNNYILDLYSEGGFIEIDLSEDELKAYVDGGYVLEEMDHGGEHPTAREHMIAEYKKNMPWMDEASIIRIVDNEIKKINGQSTIATYQKPRELVYGEPGFVEQQTKTRHERGSKLVEPIVKNIIKPVTKAIDQFQKTDLGPIGGMVDMAIVEPVKMVGNLITDIKEDPNKVAGETMQMMVDGVMSLPRMAAEGIYTEFINPNAEWDWSNIGSAKSLERAAQYATIAPLIPAVVGTGGKTVIRNTGKIVDDVVPVAAKADDVVPIPAVTTSATAPKVVTPKQIPSTKAPVQNQVRGQMQKVDGTIADKTTTVTYKSFDDNGKITNLAKDKTGKVNTEQALKILDNESSGTFKSTTVTEAVKKKYNGQIPKKIDPQELQTLADETIPMWNVEVRSGNKYGIGKQRPTPQYGIHRLDYDNSPLKFEPIVPYVNQGYKFADDPIAKSLREKSKEMGYLENEIRVNLKYIENAKADLQNPLKSKMVVESERELSLAELSLAENQAKLKTMQGEYYKILDDQGRNYNLENNALVFRSDDLYKKGFANSEHTSLDNTVAHVHYVVRSNSPKTFTVTQFQSDAFQSGVDVTRKFKESGIKHSKNELQQYANYKNAKKLDVEWSPREYYQAKDAIDGTDITRPKEWFDDQIANYERKRVFANTNNKEQTILDLNQAKIDDANVVLNNLDEYKIYNQNWESRTLQETVDYAAKNGQTTFRFPTGETNVKVQGYNKRVTEAFKDKSKMKDFVGDDLRDYNISQRYEKTYPRLVEKTYGVKPKKVTDIEGNTWWQFDIPEKVIEGSKAIIPYKRGGSVDVDLSPKDVQRYVDGGYILEEIN